MNHTRYIVAALLMLAALAAKAQIGQHRNVMSVGVNGGYVMSSVGFTPKVNQKMHGGMTAGVSFRYVCEKYFNTICSVQAEVNYSKIGWKEDILDINDAPVMNPLTGAAEEYSREMNYIQIPVFAHLAWGREEKGMQFFFQAGPQVGIYLSESTKATYDLAHPNLDDRANTTVAQETMPVENKFDYGIAAGLLPQEGGPLPDRRALLLWSGQHLQRFEKRLLREIELREHRGKAHLSVRYHALRIF